MEKHDTNQKAGDVFCPLQYMLCDTAFKPANIAIAVYKCQKGFVQDRDEQMFNTCMSSPHVITEHTMGIWKGRFPWLQNIRMLITDETESLERILKYVILLPQTLVQTTQLLVAVFGRL